MGGRPEAKERPFYLLIKFITSDVCIEALPINPSPEPLRVWVIIQEACRFAWTQRQVLPILFLPLLK